MFKFAVLRIFSFMIRQLYFSYISLAVVVKCQFLQTAIDTEATTGSVVTLICQISTAHKSVEWHHTPVGGSYPATVYYDERIFDAYKGRFTVNGSWQRGEFDLMISAVNLDDAGKYTCTSGLSSHAAELIVLQHNPPQSCIVITPSGGAIGQNGCRIEPDLITLSCNISYRGNIHPVLEWNSMPSSSFPLKPSSETVYNVTVSTLTVRADQAAVAQYSCFVKYPNYNMKSSYSWNASIPVNKFINQTKTEYSDCQIENMEKMECTASHNFPCEYLWMLLNDSSWKSFPSASTLTVQHLSNGVYSCVARCTIRQRQCTIVQQNFVQSCTERNLGAMPNSAVVIAVCITIVALIISILLVTLYIMHRKHIRPCKACTCVLKNVPKQSPAAAPTDVDDPFISKTGADEETQFKDPVERPSNIGLNVRPVTLHKSASGSDIHDSKPLC